MSASSAKQNKNICFVCGDSATGFSYGCFTCKSCKIFFHRNSKVFEKLKCRHNGSCPVNYITRSCCTKCRMDKCFSVGMNRLETAKNTKFLNSSLNLIETFISTEIQKVINHFGDNYLEDKPKTMAITERKKRFATDLSAFELQQIENVKEARKVFGDEFAVPIIRPTSHMVEIFKIPEIYFRWTIKFCKNFEAFKSLSKEDQWALLKYFIWACTAVHFGFLHDSEKNGYPMFENNDADHAIFVIYDISNGGKISKNLEISDVNTKFWNSLSEEMGKDTTIRDLLSAQLLFFYHEDTSCPEFIKYNYNYYSYLLIRYLEHKFKNINNAKQKYIKLMRILKDLPLVKENERILFSDFDCKLIPELVMEMYHVT